MRKKNQKLIIEKLKILEKNPEEKILDLNLMVQKSQPKITTAEVNSLGIKELIGEGVSWFYGSIASRIHNIQLASSKINGILIPPGEIFSFNQTVGEVSAATGYQQAYVIERGRTVLGDGGGLCQVSTTLFRAALHSGLPIIERQPHAYRVSYYEYNSGPGLDATVYDPKPDFKFKNDTPAHILIQTLIDVPNRKLTFQFYGTSDGRQIYISEPKIWDQIAPPPDLYQDDPTLPAGTVKQIDWKAWGAKVSFNYKVTRGNEVLQDETFYSSYRPWQAVF
jgi:vancomycin resistance protein YoaR